MNFDINRTLALIRGALFDAEATWRSYLPEAGDWKKTAVLLTGPLIVLAALLGYLIGLLGADASLFGFRPTLVSTLTGIVTGAIAAAIVAFVVSALAGMFGGRNDFALGLAATTLAFVPGYLGQALRWLPLIGGLVALGLFIYALVLLWKIIPIYLDVPAGKRTGHYILSLLGTAAVFIVVSILLRPIVGTPAPDFGDRMITGPGDSVSSSGGSGSSGIGGIFGEAVRQGELITAADEDRYQPPADGRLEEAQVREFARVMSRTAELTEERAARLRELAERAEENEDLSLSDLGQLVSGATGAAGMNTLEIEVVKSAGGNWAEHQWVRQTLRTAYIQRDGNETIEHNFSLYEEYADELERFVAP